MVSKKKLNRGRNGYQATSIPKAPRSIRKRGPRKDLVKESKLCPFDLLAAVAGKLLQENESSASSNVAEGNTKLSVCLDENEKQQFVDDKPTKSESLDHGSCAESAFVPEISIHKHNLLSSFKEQPKIETNSVLEQTSALSSSGVKKKVICDIKLEAGEIKTAGEDPASKLGRSISVGDGVNHKLECGPELNSEDDKNHPANTSTVKDPIEEFVNTNAVINSEDSVQLPLQSDPIPDAALQKHLNNADLGTRDDDENSSGCNKSSTKVKSFRPQQHIGHSRIRKILTYKPRKAVSLQDCEVYDAGEVIKPFYGYRKRNDTLGISQQVHIKKRKLSDHSSAIVYDQDTSSDSISSFPENGIGIATGSSVTIRDQEEAKDHHVKFSIKSFKVPELCIEVSEDASIDSLKRAVVETVTNIFGSGFQVGVVLEGKTVQDDNKTLQEAGICGSGNLDTLNFTLEPSYINVSSPVTSKNLPSLLPQDSDQELARSPASPVVDSGFLDAQIDMPAISKLDDNVENNEFKSSPRTPTDEITAGVVPDPDSKALVLIPPMNVESLAVVPVNQQPKRNEPSSRRTRRPFTVAEVEALVESVEKLGTGRWRDVKIGAFEHADHRTYVDLKDKWKTLVHTASIAPQQRRGEPVPQELLDRVLAAHSYWSQHQSKQNGKPLVEPLKTVVPDERQPEPVQA